MLFALLKFCGVIKYYFFLFWLCRSAAFAFLEQDSDLHAPPNLLAPPSQVPLEGIYATPARAAQPYSNEGTGTSSLLVESTTASFFVEGTTSSAVERCFFSYHDAFNMFTLFF
jgi:hypothetical protein